MDRRFGISTHLFHDTRLTREHLVHIAAHGFEAIELCATRTHFDYRNPDAIAQLGKWLSDTRLDLHSVHAPIAEGMNGRTWLAPYSNASGNDLRRRAAVAETEAALLLAGQCPFRYLVLHPTPDSPPGPPARYRATTTSRPRRGAASRKSSSAPRR